MNDFKMLHPVALSPVPIQILLAYGPVAGQHKEWSFAAFGGIIPFVYFL